MSLSHNLGEEEEDELYSQWLTDDDSPSYLAQDISSLLNPVSDSSDVTIMCNGVSFPVHKAILAARSDVFATMFKQKDTVEAATNEVKIDDAETKTMNNFLK